MTQIAQEIAAASEAAELAADEDKRPARILVHCSESTDNAQVVVERTRADGKVEHYPLKVLALKFEMRGTGEIRLVLEMAPDQVMLEVLPTDVVVIEREKKREERDLGTPEMPF